MITRSPGSTSILVTAVIASLGIGCGRIGFDPADCGDGQLDPSEVCDYGEQNGGVSCCTVTCELAPSTTVCRAGSGDMCDPPEACTGASAACPQDLLQPTALLCRTDADGPGGCDFADYCPGVAGEPCPDLGVADGMPCAGDGEAPCSLADTCLGNVCNDNEIAPGDPCGPALVNGECNPDMCDAFGACIDNPIAADGTACTGNGMSDCSGVDTCLVGVCLHRDFADGTVCSGNGVSACSGPDTCLAGSCYNNDILPGRPCGAALTEPDCNPDVCNANGVCVDQPFALDNTPCTGNGVTPCSGADTCMGGVCMDRDQPQGTPCDSGVLEPTCNPDVCSAGGLCLDAAPAPQDTLCADNGGNTCCSARCIVEAMPGVCSSPSCLLPAIPPRNVAIISSSVVGNTMHDTWATQATAVGMAPTVLFRTVLESINNLANYNILIVSNGVDSLTANAQATVRAFAESGRSVYLQTEYSGVETNATFANIVNGNGGTFTWGAGIMGDLAPVTVLGCFALEPEAVTTLSYYFWGKAGSGTPTPILRKNGQNIGFAFCMPSTAYLITTTDHDWIRGEAQDADSAAVVRNILARLAFPCQ